MITDSLARFMLVNVILAFFITNLISMNSAFAQEDTSPTQGYIKCIDCGGAAPANGGSDTESDPKFATSGLLGDPAPSLSQLKALESGASQNGTTPSKKGKTTTGTGEQ